MNPANPSPSQQKSRGADETSKSAETCASIPAAHKDSVQAVASGGWFALWQARPRRDELCCTGCPPSLRIKKVNQILTIKTDN